MLSSSSSEGHDSHDSSGKTLVYVGPFAGVTLRLKRVSVATASLGLMGIPALTYLNSDVPLSGQVAVSGTALLAAVGSTVLLNYCVTPYVHEIVRDGDQFTATTVNIFGFRADTTFRIGDVVGAAQSGTSRPFCNFVAAGVPMYIHGELFDDKELLEKFLQRPLTKSELEGRSEYYDEEGEE